MLLPKLLFDVAFTVNPGNEVAELDWVDLSDRLRPTDQGGQIANVSYGRKDEDSTAEAAVAKVFLDNLDRALDPTNPTSPYSGYVLPFRPARLRVDIGGVVHPLFYGFVEKWPLKTPAWRDSYVPASFVGPRKWLAGIDLQTVDLPAQSVRTRINAVLDLAGWPAGMRDLDTGVVKVDAVEGEEVNVIELIDDATTAEDSLFFFAPDGTATFHGRHRRIVTMSPSLTFGEGVGEVNYPEVEFKYDDDWIINDARVERAFNCYTEIYSFQDLTSITRYGVRSAASMDVQLEAQEAIAHAAWTVLRYSEPMLRLDDIAINAYQSNAILTELVTGELGDLNRFLHPHADGSGILDISFHREGVSHDISGSKWATKLQLSPYFGGGPWLTWDTAFGWDTEARWAP